MRNFVHLALSEDTDKTKSIAIAEKDFYVGFCVLS